MVHAVTQEAQWSLSVFRSSLRSVLRPGGGLLVALLGMVCLLRFGFILARVQGTSMFPALHDGDWVLVFRYWPHLWLRRGQIVLVQPESSRVLPGSVGTKAGRTLFIKRIAGMPGNKVVRYEQELGVRAFALSVPGVAQVPSGLTYDIPPGHIFVQSDNPSLSIDSRVWGPLELRSVIGVVVRVLPTRP